MRILITLSSPESIASFGLGRELFLFSLIHSTHITNGEVMARVDAYSS